jgi:hypothetical protein
MDTTTDRATESVTRPMAEGPHISPAAFWILGIVQDEDGSLTGPGKAQSSYLTECDCPDDCLRDHETD